MSTEFERKTWDPRIVVEQVRPAEPDHNQTARQVTAANAAVSMIPFENRKVRRAADMSEADARRLVVMLGYVGEIAERLQYGEDRHEDPLLKLASAAIAWLDAIEQERAR